MTEVWKFKLDPEQGVGVEAVPVVMPAGATVLSAAAIGADMFVWALVNPDERVRQERRFIVAGTGFGVDEHRLGRFLGTCLMPVNDIAQVIAGISGATAILPPVLVWHVWEAQ